jgi:hypothetical protein
VVIVVTAEVGCCTLVGVEVGPSANGDSFDRDGGDLVWCVSVDQAKSRPTDPVRIEVQFVAVPEVSGAHPGIQLDPTGLAVTDEDKHIQRHLPGAQVWERVDVLLKAR